VLQEVLSLPVALPRAPLPLACPVCLSALPWCTGVPGEKVVGGVAGAAGLRV